VVPAALDASEPPGSPAAPDAAEFSTAVSVWILDDDPVALESLQGQLAAWGADVTAYARPEDLLARLHAGVPLPHWILTGNTAPARLAELRSSRFR
jgi:hypothetical protein